MHLSFTAQKSLRCPICHGAFLDDGNHRLQCLNPECQTVFPILDGIPILINESSSIFSIEDFIAERKTYFSDTREKSLKKKLLKVLPDISRNVKGKANYQHFSELLLRQISTPKILILGGSILGEGMECIARNSAFELVDSDISFGPRTKLICDAHDIPFADQTFDGVIVQAVLEHVVDPYRCVDEIYRVLKPKGLVYAETPFMQQVHGGRYDFTRFTHLGHRRLFRWFEEIESGVVCGPGMALAWSYQYFLTSFTAIKPLRAGLGWFARFTSFFWKYFDYYLVNQPGALDAASGFYFMGRKSDRVLPDRELITLYRGTFY